MKNEKLNWLRNIASEKIWCWLLCHAVTVFSCVLIVGLGIAFLTRAVPVTTTIGENIATNDLSVAGNITSGVWQGTAIGTQYGGTGANWSAVAQGNLPYFSAIGALSNLAPGTAGQFLKTQGAGADPTWANVTRSATFVIAASNSSTKSKQQADYVCDGTDDNVEIQAAIDALPTGGGKILLLEGTYIINPTQDVYVAGWKAGMVITSNNIEIEGTQGTVLKMKDGVNLAVGAGAIFFYLEEKSNINIHNLYFNGNLQNITATYINGIFMYSGARIRIENNYFTNVKHAVWGDRITGVYFAAIINNNILDLGSAGDGISLHNTANQTLITNNIIIAPKIGIFVDSVQDSIIQGNIISNPKVSGINLFDSVYDCLVTDNIITGQTTGVQWGIDIYVDPTTGKPTSDRNVIKNNLIKDIDDGIRVQGNGNDIEGNKLYSINVTAIQDLGVSSIIKNNIGYTTENSGTATIASGATSIVVNHGLATTPTRVFITPTNSMGNATKFYVDTLTATQFTIHTDVDPGATTAIFNWRAVVGEGN